MGYPSYVKMIGMTESKKLLLRKTLMLDCPYSGEKTKNVFQIVLNPLECPNIEKAFTVLSIADTKDQTPVNAFKYDYMRVKNIFISIKPAQSISASNGTEGSLYTTDGDTPLSNVYAYFTYKFPMLSPKDEWKDDKDAIIRKMYGTDPDPDRITMEGKMKNTYSWPCNKPMTISINRLLYRVSNEPYRICPNSPLDLQYLSTLSITQTGVYNPFDYVNPMTVDPSGNDPSNDDEPENKQSTYENSERGVKGEDGIKIPDMQMYDDYNLFFGRLVIVAPKKVRFTAEICYDCVLLR